MKASFKQLHHIRSVAFLVRDLSGRHVAGQEARLAKMGRQKGLCSFRNWRVGKGMALSCMVTVANYHSFLCIVEDVDDDYQEGRCCGNRANSICIVL